MENSTTAANSSARSQVATEPFKPFFVLDPARMTMEELYKFDPFLLDELCAALKGRHLMLLDELKRIELYAQVASTLKAILVDSADQEMNQSLELLECLGRWRVHVEEFRQVCGGGLGASAWKSVEERVYPTVIDVSYIRPPITCIPPQVLANSRLTSLTCTAPSLQTWPVPLVYLRELLISKCGIRAIPESISLLTALEKLHASDNRELAELPNQFSALQRLTSLNFSSCRALKISTELLALTNLRILNLYEVPLDEIVFSEKCLLRELYVATSGALCTLFRQPLWKLQVFSATLLAASEDRNWEVSEVSLCIDNLEITWVLPESISTFSALRQLRCEGLSKFPCAITCLTRLEYLSLVGGKFESVPENLSLLTTLRSLNLAFCEELLALPLALYSLPSLTALQVRNAAFEQSALERLPFLRHLVTMADGIGIEFAGDGLGPALCESQFVLSLESRGPEPILYSLRTHVKHLQLQYVSCSAHFTHLYNMTALAYTGIKVPQVELQLPPSLTKLDLSAVQGLPVETLSLAIGPLTSLQTLCVKRVKLSQLPSTITVLTRLKSLDVSMNQLTDIDCLSVLTSLSWLDARQNLITHLPPQFCSCHFISPGWFGYVGNPLPEAIIHLQFNTSGLWYYLHELGRSNRTNAPVRLVFIGNAYAGKTTLYGALKASDDSGVRQAYEVKRDRTNLIEVDKWEGMNVWDFGGQIEYFTTHSTFLRDEYSVYVVVINASDNGMSAIEQLKFWLSMLQASFRPLKERFEAGMSRVIVAISHCEHYTPNDRKAMRREVDVLAAEHSFEKHLDGISFVGPTADQIIKLCSSIISASQKLAEGSHIPRSYKQVLNTCHALAESVEIIGEDNEFDPIISLHTLCDRCVATLGITADIFTLAIDLWDACGELVCFGDPPIVFLRPNALFNTIASLILRDQRENATRTHEEMTKLCKAILKRVDPNIVNVDAFLRALQDLGVCVDLESEKLFLFPDMLPLMDTTVLTETRQWWERGATFGVRIEAPFLPHALFHLVQVAIANAYGKLYPTQMHAQDVFVLSDDAKARTMALGCRMWAPHAGSYAIDVAVWSVSASLSIIQFLHTMCKILIDRQKKKFSGIAVQWHVLPASSSSYLFMSERTVAVAVTDALADDNMQLHACVLANALFRLDQTQLSKTRVSKLRDEPLTLSLDASGAIRVASLSMEVNSVTGGPQQSLLSFLSTHNDFSVNTLALSLCVGDNALRLIVKFEVACGGKYKANVGHARLVLSATSQEKSGKVALEQLCNWDVQIGELVEALRLVPLNSLARQIEHSLT